MFIFIKVATFYWVEVAATLKKSFFFARSHTKIFTIFDVSLNFIDANEWIYWQWFEMYWYKAIKGGLLFSDKDLTQNISYQSVNTSLAQKTVYVAYNKPLM